MKYKLQVLRHFDVETVPDDVLSRVEIAIRSSVKNCLNLSDFLDKFPFKMMKSFGGNLMESSINLDRTRSNSVTWNIMWKIVIRGYEGFYSSEFEGLSRVHVIPYYGLY